MKGNKGITLIALVITIIVLLILAGVSIAMLTGENSILSRGSQASAENQLGAANDAVSLYVAEKVAEFYENAYVSNKADVLQAGLNGYLANTCDNSSLGSDVASVKGITPAVLQKVIDNKNITTASGDGSSITVNWKLVDTSAAGTTTTGTGAEAVTKTRNTPGDVFVIRLNDNQNTYTSTGTYQNGKVTWKVEKGNKVEL